MLLGGAVLGGLPLGSAQGAFGISLDAVKSTANLNTFTTSATGSAALSAGATSTAQSGNITTNQVVSIGLSSVTATCSTGVDTTGQVDSTALTSVYSTAQTGTVTLSLVLSLSSVQATSTANTFTTAATGSATLSNATSNNTVGTITASQAVSKSLTSVTATQGLGTITTGQVCSSALSSATVNCIVRNFGGDTFLNIFGPAASVATLDPANEVITFNMPVYVDTSYRLTGGITPMVLNDPNSVVV